MIRLLLLIFLLFFFVCPAAAQTAQTSSQPVLLANSTPVQPSGDAAQTTVTPSPEKLPEAPPLPPTADETAPASEIPQGVIREALPVSPDCVPAATRPAEAQTQHEKPSVGLKIVDVALVRPFCVIGSTVSTAVYIAISPLAAVMGLGEPAARAMVEAPWRFTAFRYVGEFNHYKDEQPLTGVWDFL